MIIPNNSSYSVIDELKIETEITKIVSFITTSLKFEPYCMKNITNVNFHYIAIKEVNISNTTYFFMKYGSLKLCFFLFQFQTNIQN